MSPIRPTASPKVRRFARLLTRRAIAVLGVLLGACLAALGGAVWLVVSALGGEGLTVAAALQCIGAVLLAVQAARIGSWLWVPPPPAEGVPLARTQAPALYRMADRLAVRSRAPRVDAIRISPDINAAIHQRPRWACCGPIHTTLIIGLPLVHSVSPRQLAAIVAHEMAHLARQRSGLGAWGAHLRAWWHRACERIAADNSVVARVLQGSFEAWAERDLLDAVRLNHFEEYEADRAAAAIVGVDLLGETLVEVAMKAKFIESDYWDKVMAQAAHQPRPTIRPFRDMGMGVAAGFHDLRRSGVLRSVVLSETGQQMHPTLADRLRALGVVPGVRRAGRDAEVTPCSAATRFLNPALPGLAGWFDRRWWKTTRSAWRRHYHDCRARGGAACPVCGDD
ncbi:MAG: M48 family metallopeptidase [Rhodocyclaceae bacterium]|nr:M48 family metallopeptidase [Rhodocyclaceae bacterium]MCB1961867.1 M48 family metallopeptidase [Rhodocyclaceae bacterium]